MSLDQNLDDRLRRAASWLRAASDLERTAKPDTIDHHSLFIYRYIAFNSLYGKWKLEGDERKAWKQFDAFFDNILLLHAEDQKCKGSRRLILRDALRECRPDWLKLIDNEFLDLQGYWEVPAHGVDFKKKYGEQKFTALRKLDQQNYKDLLQFIFFYRIWVLRNQIIHGGCTFGRVSKGWNSLETANPVLRVMVPAFRNLMEAYPEAVAWPAIPYPRYGSKQHVKRP